jgi:myo-inositol-1(or 4)-monophosphatase
MTADKDPTLDDLKEFALSLTKKAGKEALHYYGKGKTQVKFDENLITEAELHLKDFFQTHMAGRFPDHHIFNKDDVGDAYSHEGGRYLWIFDPIDGVDNFQAGIPIWGMSLALLENFWPVMGIFYMPATEDIFHAQAGDKAYWDDEAIHVNTKQDVDDESLLLTFSRFHQHYQSRFPGKMRNLGCTAAHICYVAMGRADAAVIANESYQDLAATRVIIESAGGRISKMDGSRFHLNEFLDGGRIEEHLMVASQENYGQVLNYLNKNY